MNLSLTNLAQHVTDARPYLEALSFLSGVGLLFVAMYAAKQVRLLKIDIMSRNDRASKERALEAADAYLNDYVPLFNVWFEFRVAKDIPRFSGKIGNFSLSALGMPIPETTLARLRAKQDSASGWLQAINKLESIAALFACGVADEKLGFSVCGRSFCGSVASDYDLISIYRDDGGQQYFENIVTLFELWSPRLSKAELEAEKKAIESKISKISQPKAPSISPDLR